MTDAPRFRPDVEDIHRPYAAAADRYSGHGVPPGRHRPGSTCRPSRSGCGGTSATTSRSTGSGTLLRHAFDKGITHFDLANNYGPPYGSAETNFGRMMREDFAPYRDELIISSKAGYDMWPGPYGDLGSRKYILASAEQSLRADERGLRRHLLLAPRRPGDADRGDDRGARHARAAGQGAVRRHLVVQRRAHRDRGGRRTQPRHAAGHPPAVVLDPEPLGRGRPDRAS